MTMKMKREWIRVAGNGPPADPGQAEATGSGHMSPWTWPWSSQSLRVSIIDMADRLGPD